MTRISDRLALLRKQTRTALVPFITAGDPNLDVTVPSLHALVRGGADILEIGIPFSDPEADGPVIQAASERALANNVRLADVLDIVAGFRGEDADTPIILMGYLNNVLRMGFTTFTERAAAAGVDGLIMVNLPPEEAGELKRALESRNMDLIFLIAPTTTDERMRLIDRMASGFIYYVSLKGTTGANHISLDSVAENVTRLRQHTQLPLLVGFGIKDGPTARAVAEHADGVVIGAVLVNRMGELADSPDDIPEALYHRLVEIRQALDA
ncbi:MAG: tryptophan synthase subunit alpha [Gammaproteobacteria bacterium]|nr:tryptophan synthase subunit alpha [Gammaproteobacteria bacterium]